MLAHRIGHDREACETARVRRVREDRLDLGKGDRTGALMLVSELQRDYPSTPYVDQAHLAMARVYVDSNELDKAATELQAVSQHSKDKQLALVARVRLARVQIAQQKPDDALASLDGTDPGAFAPLFHEVRGDAQFAKGNKAAALTEYRQARAADVAGASNWMALLHRRTPFKS